MTSKVKKASERVSLGPTGGIVVGKHLMSLWLCGLMLALAAPALAQEEVGGDSAPTEQEIEQGRELFRQGTAQAELANWTDARDLFQQAYDLARAPIILYNLGNAQRNTGLLREALESYRRFLTAGDPERWSEQMEQIRSSMNDLLDEIPRVTIAASAMREGDSLQLDGQELSSADIQSAIQLNPGEHRLSVIREDQEVETVRFTLAASARPTIEIEAPAPPRPALPEGEEEGSNTGLWIGIGVGSAVVIGGTIAAILLLGSSQYEGNFGSGQVEVP